MRRVGQLFSVTFPNAAPGAPGQTWRPWSVGHTYGLTGAGQRRLPDLVVLLGSRLFHD